MLKLIIHTVARYHDNLQVHAKLFEIHTTTYIAIQHTNNRVKLLKHSAIVGSYCYIKF